MSVDGCLFNDNYASKKGGGVHVGKGQVSVVDSLFFNNLAGSDNVESGECWRGNRGMESGRVAVTEVEACPEKKKKDKTLL